LEITGNGEVAVAGRAAAAEISAEDMEAFGVTIYEEREGFPLEGLVDLDGKPYDFSGLRGKYVLVNLWASWCPYCRKEKPSMQGLYERQEMWFELLTIAVGEEAGTVRVYMEEEGYTFPVAVNESNSLREPYAPRIPKSYILDKEGRIMARIDGWHEWMGGEAERIVRYFTGTR
jgi:cytochrome c-type biogenesis protein